MAITRTPIVDDDGTGTTGTVFEDAWKQEFYNQIDAVAAGDARLAAANIFTNAQQISTASPTLSFTETDAAADAKRWQVLAEGQNFILQTVNDAETVVLANPLSISRAGVVSLPVGQLKFPATANPSADANTVDDFERGNWTITVTFGGAAVGVTYTANTGRYIKIGNFVRVVGGLFVSNKGSSTGNALISGLPFTVGATNSDYNSAGSYYTAFAAGVAAGMVTYAVPGSATIFPGKNAAGGVVQTVNTDWANGCAIFISAAYFI